MPAPRPILRLDEGGDGAGDAFGSNFDTGEGLEEEFGCEEVVGELDVVDALNVVCDIEASLAVA